LEINLKHGRQGDWPEIVELYKLVAKNKGGLARGQDEISWEYVTTFLRKSEKTGLSLIATDGLTVVGEIHAYKLEPMVFSHVLSELTIAIHPDFQGKGIGRILFSAFLEEIISHRPDILRVELIARESNKKAIQFYETLGFRQEGRYEQRIDRGDGTFEADIPMAWLRK
jgi:ribosomal protein S18 acetylase RimI-like enzyme